MIVFAAFVLGCFMLLSIFILINSIKSIDKLGFAHNATMKCLIELVEKLNEEFPGSDLKVIDTNDEIKVIGELKYYKKQ